MTLDATTRGSYAPRPCFKKGCTINARDWSNRAAAPVFSGFACILNAFGRVRATRNVGFADRSRHASMFHKG